MSQEITITLSPENQAALKEIESSEQIDDIINQALADYFFIRRFREIRARMMQGIEKFGVRSDDDVFALVS